jgi:hypothetical protein
MKKRAKRRRSVRQILKATTAIVRSRDVQVRIAYAGCSLFSSEPERCPLCRAKVPAFTQHACERKG